jgi:flavin reductase (DIM6/NTAB) family NADH-FMN oxidoreductase RutF
VIPGDAAGLDSAVLRRAYSCFASGVTAVCALVNGAPVGMAASAFTSVSLDPPLVSICVARSSATWARLRTAERIGVSVLAAAHPELCRQLSAREGDRFAGVDWWSTPEDAVLIADTTARLVCTLVEELPAGDHEIALLRVEALEADPEAQPLVFHASQFRSLIEGAGDVGSRR